MIGRRKSRPDPVTPELRLAVFERDKGCVAVKLGANPSDCRGRATLDHVLDQARLGKRAPSDMGHLVAMCEAHHLWNGWATAHRPELRAYLRGFMPPDPMQMDATG